MDFEHIIVVGAGGTGAALAHDLTLRGYKVTVFEKGELVSGTTGRHHGLLHSGARYAVHDPEAAKKCLQENRILKRIAPDAIEKNDGLFVAVDEEDMAYRQSFLNGCKACRIPTTELHPERALALEPAPTDEQLTDDPCLRALGKLVEGGTLVLILPRRLQTLRRADRVILLNGPRLVGEGKHAELLANSDLYRHLNYLLFNPYRHQKVS